MVYREREPRPGPRRLPIDRAGGSGAGFFLVGAVMALAALRFLPTLFLPVAVALVVAGALHLRTARRELEVARDRIRLTARSILWRFELARVEAPTAVEVAVHSLPDGRGDEERLDVLLVADTGRLSWSVEGRTRAAALVRRVREAVELSGLVPTRARPELRGSIRSKRRRGGTELSWRPRGHSLEMSTTGALLACVLFAATLLLLRLEGPAAGGATLLIFVVPVFAFRRTGASSERLRLGPRGWSFARRGPFFWESVSGSEPLQVQPVVDVEPGSALVQRVRPSLELRSGGRWIGRAGDGLSEPEIRWLAARVEQLQRTHATDPGADR